MQCAEAVSYMYVALGMSHRSCATDRCLGNGQEDALRAATCPATLPPPALRSSTWGRVCPEQRSGVPVQRTGTGRSPNRTCTTDRGGFKSSWATARVLYNGQRESCHCDSTSPTLSTHMLRSGPGQRPGCCTTDSRRTRHCMSTIAPATHLPTKHRRQHPQTFKALETMDATGPGVVRLPIRPGQGSGRPTPTAGALERRPLKTYIYIYIYIYHIKQCTISTYKPFKGTI